MSDAALLWGGDIGASPVGDIALTDSTALGQQRLLRRLLTNKGDYVWNLDYGAGLGQFVGSPINVERISSAIRSQIFLENVVARSPEPVIDVSGQLDGGVYVSIRYVDAANLASQVLSFTVGI